MPITKTVAYDQIHIEHASPVTGVQPVEPQLNKSRKSAGSL